MSDETTLLPCPFCGGEAEPFNPFDTTDGTWTVLCSECASSVGFEQTRAEAIAAWNTRAELGNGTCNPVETETLENVTAHVMECDRCGKVYEHVNGAYEHCPRCGRRVER